MDKIKKCMREEIKKLTPWNRVLPSWEANTSSYFQEIPYVLGNPKVHHRTDMRPPPVLILSQIHPVHVSHSTF
jgi:hypothetical protein